MTLTNGDIAELLLGATQDEVADHRRRALHRAARAAMFQWPEEASSLLEEGRSLTELPAVGPWVARRVGDHLRDDREPPPPPPLRRGFLTLAGARATLAEHPEWREALRADLQMHTTYSDGKAPLREMAESVALLGYRYVAITDHSKSLRIARGMDEERLAQQGEDIGRANRELALAGRELTLLRGIEMDLDREGRGDMEPASVARLDLVLGAFHTMLRSEEDQTERYLGALRNPLVQVLAHPRGRRYDTRLGVLGDWDRILETAVEQDTALEIDAFPDRQDLDVELLTAAREAGARISIGTDAHRPSELGYMEFGLAAAIRAGIRRHRILNFQPVEEVLAWATAVRDRH
jgi:DNA polymerase (family 10)